MSAAEFLAQFSNRTAGILDRAGIHCEQCLWLRRRELWDLPGFGRKTWDEIEAFFTARPHLLAMAEPDDPLNIGRVITHTPQAHP